MYRFIVAAVAAALLASPAFAGGCTGIGKGSPMSGAAKTPVTTPNPCKPGDTYDATKNLCTAADGTTYTPASP
jgi:hypothetical protein